MSAAKKEIRCSIGLDGQYPWAMYVTKSNHPRFSVGTRFDYGFMGIALDEGYGVIVSPVPSRLRERDVRGRLVWKNGNLIAYDKRRKGI